MMLFTPLYSIFFEAEILHVEIYLRKLYPDAHKGLYKDVHQHIAYVTQMSVKFTLH